MEFITEFQDFMNEAIEQFLKKPVRKHSCRKDKSEPRTEQGKHKEALRKEAETLPPINVSGDSDDERNSRISLETMDTDQCIQKLVRTDQEDEEDKENLSEVNRKADQMEFIKEFQDFMNEAIDRCKVCLRYFYQKPVCNGLYADGL